MWNSAIVAAALQFGSVAEVDITTDKTLERAGTAQIDQSIEREGMASWVPRGEWHFAIAAGVGHRSNPLLGSESFPIYWVLDLAYYGERFFFDNGELGLLWNVSPTTQLDVFLTYTNEREYYRFFENGATPVLTHDGNDDTLSSPTQNNNLSSHSIHSNALPQRKLAIEAGIGWTYTKNWGQISFQWLSDVSNTFNGDEAWLGYQYQLFYYGVTVSLTGALSWNSAALADYYFGVAENEATDNLPYYRVGEALNRQFKFSLMIDITDNWQWVGSAHVNRLDDSIARSPIVEDEEIQTWFSGIRFQF